MTVLLRDRNGIARTKSQNRKEVRLRMCFRRLSQVNRADTEDTEALMGIWNAMIPPSVEYACSGAARCYVVMIEFGYADYGLHPRFC